MAKKAYIKDGELMVIRIGHAKGLPVSLVAKYIRRHRDTVYKHIAAMEQDGTLGDPPLDFLVEDIAELIKAVGAR